MPIRDVGREDDMNEIVRDLKGSPGIERVERKGDKVHLRYSDGDRGTVDKHGRVRIEEDRNQAGQSRWKLW